MGNSSGFRLTCCLGDALINHDGDPATIYDGSGATMASPGAIATQYDVFLSFRGEDTRHSFTDHLYDALVQAGIRPFRDNDEIDRGQELNLEIAGAIKASEASIVVLSENYATSTWCLEELCLILEQTFSMVHEIFNEFVLFTALAKTQRLASIACFFLIHPNNTHTHNIVVRN
ncbi:hypothetical protein R6Q57_021431 [Mikania cordata]